LTDLKLRDIDATAISQAVFAKFTLKLGSSKVTVKSKSGTFYKRAFPRRLAIFTGAYQGAKDIILQFSLKHSSINIEVPYRQMDDLFEEGGKELIQALLIGTMPKSEPEERVEEVISDAERYAHMPDYGAFS